jgi:hypothetical protein
MPKVDRVILALTRNNNYLGYWPYVAEIWAMKFGVIPTLVFYGDPGERELCGLSTQHGQIINLQRLSAVTLNLERDWACTWGLFYAASLFPDDVCMLAGIDQIPLGGMFFDQLRCIPSWQDNYVVGFGDAYRGHYFPSSHHVAKGSKFREIYRIEPTWKREVVKVFTSRWGSTVDGKDAWGLDETYSSERLFARMKSSGDVILINTFWSHWQPNRIERETVLTDMHFEGIRKGQFSEWHGKRPFERNDPAVLARLKEAIPVYSWT